MYHVHVPYVDRASVDPLSVSVEQVFDVDENMCLHLESIMKTLRKSSSRIMGASSSLKERKQEEEGEEKEDEQFSFALRAGRKKDYP